MCAHTDTQITYVDVDVAAPRGGKPTHLPPQTEYATVVN